MEAADKSILKIYASSTDKAGSELLYEYIVRQARAHQLKGVTVFRGIMGYGLSSHTISTSRFWELTEKLPVLIEIVDDTKILEDFYKWLEPSLMNNKKGILITMEPVRILMSKPGGGKASDR